MVSKKNLEDAFRRCKKVKVDDIPCNVEGCSEVAEKVHLLYFDMKHNLSGAMFYHLCRKCGADMLKNHLNDAAVLRSCTATLEPLNVGDES